MLHPASRMLNDPVVPPGIRLAACRHRRLQPAQPRNVWLLQAVQGNAVAGFGAKGGRCAGLCGPRVIATQGFPRGLARCRISIFALPCGMARPDGSTGVKPIPAGSAVSGDRLASRAVVAGARLVQAASRQNDRRGMCMKECC